MPSVTPRIRIHCPGGRETDQTGNQRQEKDGAPSTISPLQW